VNELLDSPELREVPDADMPKKTPPPEARSLFDLDRPESYDQTELLKYRFLCRGGGLLLCGPTGIGKSSLAMQAMISWSVGKPVFGIEPARPLKSLLIQAENDDGDLTEFRDGICAGLALTDDEKKLASGNIMVVREDARTSVLFFSEVVQPLLESQKPDLLWIDPALAYLGGETSSQRDVGVFLRNHLNPLLHKFDCAAVIVHHTNKPPSGREKPNWQGGDFAYLGSGSAEWANWARGVLALRSIGSHDVFELRAAKRGGRLGWVNEINEKVYQKFIAHAKESGAIFWREVAANEIGQTGRPKSSDADEILGLLPPEGLTAGEWQQAADKECGVKESTFHRHRRVLEKQNRVLKSKVSKKWQPIEKT
jgi:hypothetical protein